MKSTIFQYCFALFVLIEGSYGLKKLPSYIEKCKKGEGFDECAIINGNKAIPYLAKGDASLGFPVMDPFTIEHVVLINNPDLSFNVTKASILGIRNLYITNTTMTDNHIYHAMIAPNLTLIGNYEINGRILVLPITGNGGCEYNFINVTVIIEIDYEVYNKEDVSYMRVVNSSIELFPKKIIVKMDNLFGGDPLLGNQINTFLNENWEEAYKQFSPHISQKLNELFRVLSAPIESLPLGEIIIQ